MPALFSIVLGLVTLAAAPADTAPPTDSAVVYPGTRGRLTVDAPSVSERDAAIDIDGTPDEAAWKRAAVLTDFTQYDPIEGVPARQSTEVLLFYTPDALYVAARAHDVPGGVRATLAQRDQIARSGDWIRVVLDTYDDAQRAYVFYVNPLGVQQDGLWIEGLSGRRGSREPIDYSPDFIWESAGHVTDYGYSVELRIPLKSLRFPDAKTQSWGINVSRRVQRTGWESSWAPLSRDRSNKLEQSGQLVGLRDLDRGLFLELNPVLTARRIGTVDDSTGIFSHDPPDPQFGLNLTYGLTSNLTLDATYNPDFSQVEADAGQVAVNERFALFYPEKRPFFLAGTEIFQMPTSLVYTRTIGNPIAGAKMTGKLGSTNVGYLGAVDQPDDGGDAIFNIVRLRRDVGRSGYAGFLYTDRSLPSGGTYNRVAASDARLLFGGGRYTLQLVGAGSLDRRDGEDATVGSLLLAHLSRSGRGLSFDAGLTDIAPEFHTASGFIRRTGDAELQGQVRFRSYGKPGDLVEDWGPSLQLRRVWAHDEFWRGGRAAEGQLQLGVSAGLRGNLYVNGEVSRGFYDYATGDYGGLLVQQADGTLRPFLAQRTRFDGLWGGSLMIFANSLSWLRGNLRGEWQEQPIFAPGSVAEAQPAVELADAYSLRVNMTLQPTAAATLDLGLQQKTLFRQRDGSRYSSATIPRLQAQYQFTRAVYARLIGEYSAESTGDLLDPVTGLLLAGCDADGLCSAITHDPSNRFHVEALFAYEPSPGTVFYAGYSRDMTEARRFAFGALQPQLDGIFLKFSYRYRL